MGNEINKVTKKFGKKAPPPKKIPTSTEVKTFIMIAQNKLTLFRNKRVNAIRTKRKEIGACLRDNNLDVAKAKMSTIIGDEDTITVYDILGPILEILKEKVTYLMTHDECPVDLKANLDTVIYSSSRLEVEELHKIRDLIRMKYGDMYISKGDSNADGLVNKNLIEKLRVKQSSDTLLTVRLKQLCKEENINFEFPFDIGSFDASDAGGMADHQGNFNPYSSKIDMYGGGGMGQDSFISNNQNPFGDSPQNTFGNFGGQMNNNNNFNQMNQGDFGNFNARFDNNGRNNMGGQGGFGQNNMNNQGGFGQGNMGGSRMGNQGGFGQNNMGGFGQGNQGGFGQNNMGGNQNQFNMNNNPNPYGTDSSFGNNQQQDNPFGGFGNFNKSQQNQQQQQFPPSNNNQQNDFPPSNDNPFGGNNNNYNPQNDFPQNPSVFGDDIKNPFETTNLQPGGNNDFPSNNEPKQNFNNNNPFGNNQQSDNPFGGDFPKDDNANPYGD